MPPPAAFHLNVQTSAVIKLSKHIHICVSATSDVADCARQEHIIVWNQVQAWGNKLVLARFLYHQVSVLWLKYWQYWLSYWLGTILGIYNPVLRKCKCILYNSKSTLANSEHLKSAVSPGCAKKPHGIETNLKNDSQTALGPNNSIVLNTIQ